MSKLTKIIIILALVFGVVGAIQINKQNKSFDLNDKSNIFLGEGIISKNFCHNGFSNVSSFIKDSSGNITGCELSKCDGGIETFTIYGDQTVGCDGTLEEKLVCVIDKCSGNFELKVGSCKVSYNNTLQACMTSMCPPSPNAYYNVTPAQYQSFVNDCSSQQSSLQDLCVAGKCATNAVISNIDDEPYYLPSNIDGSTGNLDNFNQKSNTR